MLQLGARESAQEQCSAWIQSPLVMLWQQTPQNRGVPGRPEPLTARELRDIQIRNRVIVAYFLNQFSQFLHWTTFTPNRSKGARSSNSRALRSFNSSTPRVSAICCAKWPKPALAKNEVRACGHFRRGETEPRRLLRYAWRDRCVVHRGGSSDTMPTRMPAEWLGRSHGGLVP